MKTKQFRWVAIHLLAGSLFACQWGQQPVTSPKPAPSASPVEMSDAVAVDLLQGRQIISGQLMDAKTKQLVTVATNITITGDDAVKLEKTQLKTENGTFGLALKPAVKATPNAPLHLTVVADADGYFIGSAQVNISDLNEAFVLNLTNKTQAPAGVGTASDNTASTAANGSLNQALNLQAQVNGAQASFGLNAGTVITGENGQLLSGPLQTDVGYFSNQSPESLNAFPGGFAPNGVNVGNQNQQGYFVTGGFVSVDIKDQAGNKATHFSQPANVSVQIPANTINPDTGKTIVDGDKIGIWSHDTKTGKWSKEGEGTAQKNANGNFDVNYQVGHLSYWNLDWFYSDRCNPKLNLIWDSENHIPVMVKLLMNDQNWYTHSNVLQDPVNDLFNVPINKEMTFVANFGTKEVGQTKVTLDQSCQPINLNINTQNLPVMKKLPLKVTLSSQTSFTMYEIESVARRFGLNDEMVRKVLAYTHPSNPRRAFNFNDKAYQDLKGLGVSSSQIEALKYLLAQVYGPSTTMSYYVENDPYSYGNVEIKDGKGEVSLYENTTYNFYGYVYYNDQYFYISKTVTVKPEDTQIRIDLKNVELTIEVVKGFLDKLGIQIPVS